MRAHEIRLLVDVRTIPRSRHNPQFNTDTLASSLREVGIQYRHLPELGGLRKPKKDSFNDGWRNASFRGYADYMQTDEFLNALEELIADSRLQPTAIMCAEAVPWRCHRSLIADALVSRGWEVRHIMGSADAKPHQLTSLPGAWLAAAVWSAPDNNPYLMIPITVIKQFLNLPPPNPTAPGIFRLANPADLAGMLQEAGFTSIAEEEFLAEVRFPSGEEYYESLMDIAAPIQNLFAKLSDEQKTDARDRIVASADQHRRANGIALPIAVRMVAARKPI